MAYDIANLIINLKKEIAENSGGGGGGIDLPTEYITTGLTMDGFAIVSGGYYKIGNCVFVNIELVATTSGNGTISGFPGYSGLSESDIVLCTAYDQTWGDVIPNLKLTKTGSIGFGITGDWHYTINASYLCDAE